MAELTALHVPGWTEVVAPPSNGAGIPTRVLRHEVVPDAIVHLAREALGVDGLEVDAYADRQVAELGSVARLLDRRELGDDARHLRLTLAPAGCPVTTDLLVRVRGGHADVCVVSRPTARNLDLLDDVAGIVDAWVAA